MQLIFFWIFFNALMKRKETKQWTNAKLKYGKWSWENWMQTTRVICQRNFVDQTTQKLSFCFFLIRTQKWQKLKLETNKIFYGFLVL